MVVRVATQAVRSRRWMPPAHARDQSAPWCPPAAQKARPSPDRALLAGTVPLRVPLAAIPARADSQNSTTSRHAVLCLPPSLPTPPPRPPAAIAQAIPEKMPICQYFSRFGECHQPDCPFKHIEEEVKECYMYKLGWCINGPYCRYRHVKLPGPPPSILETIKLRLPSVAGGGATVHHRPVPKEGGGWTTERPEDRRARDQRAFGGQRVHRPPPPSYVCHLCRIPGHWKQQCPTLNKGGEGGEDGGGKGSYSSDRPAKRARYDSGGYQQQQSQQAAQPTAQQQQTSQQLGGWGAQPVGQQAAQQPAQQPQQQWGSQPARGPPAPQQSQPQLGGWGAKPVGQQTMPPPSHPPQQGGYYR